MAPTDAASPAAPRRGDDAACGQALLDIVTLARAATGATRVFVTLGPTHAVAAPADLSAADRTTAAAIAAGAGHEAAGFCVPITAADGTAIGAIGVLDAAPDDAPRAALAALARQAARSLADHDDDALDRLWTLTHDLIVLTDLEGRVTAANPAWVAVFGSLAADRPVYMRQFHDGTQARPAPHEIPEGEPGSVTLDYIDKDGIARVITWAFTREGGTIYGIGRDDTALRAAERELFQAQRMESLGQLTGGIAHDFNNLLTIVLGNLDIARRRLGRGETDRADRAVADASEGAQRAATLTQRLLAFARRQRLAPRAIDPQALFADLRPLVERAVTEAVEVDVAIAPDVAAIEADPAQLESAILNLVVNARDAMAGRDMPARVTLSVSDATVDEAMARRHDVAAGPRVRVSVADTGAGMTPDVLARAFEPFFTTKGVGRGTGLGLSQVEGFVRQSGGFVTIETAVDSGSTVHLWLPRSERRPDAPAPVLPDTPSDAVRDACLMVVEDNDALRELVVGTLREAGYRVIEAHDGRAALSLFARQSPPPDLVLSDVMMPGLDGFQLLEELRSRAPDTRMLLMSGYAGAAGRATLPADLLIKKPFTSATLLSRIGAVLAA